jgi:hypothetical protein
MSSAVGCSDGRQRRLCCGSIGVKRWHLTAGASFQSIRERLRSILELAIFPLGVSLDDGLRALREPLAAGEEANNCQYEAETHRLRGELLLKQDDSHVLEAEGCFQRAIEIARKRSAKSLELRAIMSLGRLRAKQGCGAEARTMLAEIWFTEGFELSDLKEDKALLDQLRTEGG